MKSEFITLLPVRFAAVVTAVADAAVIVAVVAAVAVAVIGVAVVVVADFFSSLCKASSL